MGLRCVEQVDGRLVRCDVCREREATYLDAARPGGVVLPLRWAARPAKNHHWMNYSVTNGSIFALFTSDTYLIRRATMKKLVPKKTRKAIRKSLRKIIKKHGPELAAAVAGGALGKTVSDTLTSNGKKSRKQSQSAVKAGKKKAKHGSKQAQQTDQLEMER
jgi:hypothetical protein